MTTFLVCDICDWDEVESWLTTSGLTILLIVGLLALAYLVFRTMFPRIARATLLRRAEGRDEEMQKRTDTIIGVIDRSLGLALLLVAVVTILPELGVNITAIVTGLGITGLALALGAQTLVRDGISGIFLLAEDQYRRGDVIRIADVTGTLEEITLRRTIIRDDDGVVHSVPNGSIGVVSNYTRDFARVNVQVRVAYGEDLSRVASVIDHVGAELAKDKRYAQLITDSPKAGRVESVGDAGVTITVTTRTKPSARWEIAAELRRRLADAFLAEGVRVPFPTVAQEVDGGTTG